MTNTPEQSAIGVAQPWSCGRHAIAYNEAREVLTAQQQRKSHLDDKALRTTRLTTVVVGALITAMQAFDVTVGGPVGYLGIGLLLLSFGAGVAGFSVPGPILGPGANGLRALVEMDERWERRFIGRLESAIDTNDDRLDWSLLLLLVSNLTLFIGVVATLTAVAV